MGETGGTEHWATQGVGTTVDGSATASTGTAGTQTGSLGLEGPAAGDSGTEDLEIVGDSEWRTQELSTLTK